jgi:hypothetical protein
VNLTPLLRVIGTSEMPLLFLRELVTAKSMVSSVPTIALVSYVHFTIILLS